MTTIQFGTDGIRGTAGIPPIDVPSIQKIARAVFSILPEAPTVLIAKDTRISGAWIEITLAEELKKHGATIVLCDVLPTAALACALVDYPGDLGIVITASHNPHQDNGLKFFSPEGQKLSTESQTLIQQALSNPQTLSPQNIGKIIKHADPTKAWRKRLPQIDLSQWTILIDCANGALSPYGETVLTEMGARVIPIANKPNGQNINDNVGALHPPTDLQGADVALCFDGDADRIVMVVPEHGVIDGDDFLWLLKDSTEGALVGTIMSNGGLDAALDGRLVRAKVGDQYVAAQMLKHNAKLGAEPSGHVIFTGDMPAGDGLYAALRILDVVSSPPFKIDWERWPSVQKSIYFQGKKLSLDQLQSPQDAQSDEHRVIVRYSGTESKLRILVEGKKADYWVDMISTEFVEKQCDPDDVLSE